MTTSSPAPAHTPGELTLMLGNSKGRGLINIETAMDNPHGAGQHIVSFTRSELDEANARRIVTAWNCHDDLLELCKRSLAYLTAPDPSPLEVIGFDADLKAAIAKAEGSAA